LNLFERINDDDTLHTKTFSTSSIEYSVPLLQSGDLEMLPTL